MLNKDPTVISVDNQGCLHLSKENVLNDRTKHIDVKYQMIVDCAKKGMDLLEYVPSQDNLADIFTKAIGKVLFPIFRAKLGVHTNPTCTS